MEPKSVDRIFCEAAQMASDDERAAYLENACGNDVEVRRKVELLLRAKSQAENFLESPPIAIATIDQPEITERPGTIIGPYKLLQQIGEGGMGVVFMAEQEQPVKRRVALKIIKPGMDSRQVIARFEAERQALAMMDHVNIARVFDGGTIPVGWAKSSRPTSPADEQGEQEKMVGREDLAHPTLSLGRPYFVMELVHGVPITKYCDDNHLTPRERLELFVPVCQAIQHAHQKGIIHRDIKPSNVMVTLYDGKPVPKVIDFGVAKATEQKLTERTLFTQYCTLVGTLEYMSPEQAEMSALGVDTRSDIYSLGVLLYELLTGSTPLTRQRMKEAAYAEILRMIKEEEPPKPSTRLSDSGEALASISANRHTEPAKLTKLVRGELDWIVMKALEKDRNRRYETANGFAMDVQRYLADEQVLACPPSAGYRLRKFVRRNKGPVLAASLVLLALVAGIISTAWQAVRAERARQAETERAEGEKQANAQAQRRLQQIERGNEILGSIFRDLNPRGEDAERESLRVLLGERLEAAAKQLDAEAVGDPVVLARLQVMLGLSLLELGHQEKAIELIRKASEVLIRELGPDNAEALVSMNHLALSYKYAGRMSEALPLFEETLRRRKATLGTEHRDTLSSMNNLASAYQTAGMLDKAMPLQQQALELQKTHLGPDHPHTLSSMNNLAVNYLAAAKYDQARPLLQDSLELLKKKLGPEHSDTIGTMNNLAVCYHHMRKLDLALPLYEETLKHRRAKLGPDHPHTIACMNGLAMCYEYMGKLDLAVPLLEESLKRVKVKLGPDHPNTIKSMNNLALGYSALGRHADAVKLGEETVKLQKAKLGVDHPDTLMFMSNLAASYFEVGRYAEAIALDEEILPLRTAKLGPDHPDTITTQSGLARSYLAAKQPDKALPVLNDFLAAERKRLGSDSLRLGIVLVKVGLDLLKHNLHTEAEKVLRECLAIREQKAPDDGATFHTRSVLGAALLGQKKYADAEPLLLQGYEGMKQRAASNPKEAKARLREGLERLVQLYSDWGKADEAAKWRMQLEALDKKEPGVRNQESEKKTN
jgi:serine/threonine protein kinase/tetratricopeptide (TPR) repeat protein